MAFGEQFVHRPQRVWLRRALFQVHLWMGIALGLYVVAISVSGSALFFRNAVMESTPGRRVVAGSGRLLTKDELIEAAKRAYPKYAISSIWMGKEPGLEVEIALRRGEGKPRLRIFDPYTGRDMGEAVPYLLQFISWCLDLHVNLFSGGTGRVVNGVFSILLTLVCLTGAVIWWPGIKTWRRSLTINPRANWKRINWDLHSALGFWSFAFVFMWAFTGVYLVFPHPFEVFVHKFAPLDYYRPISLLSEPSSPPVENNSVAFVTVADVGPKKDVAPPQGDVAPKKDVVSKASLAPATDAKQSNTATTQAQSAPKAPVRRRRPPPHYSAGDMVFRISYGAHFGNFAGMKTRILWAVIGLMPTFLFITGAVMWWNRVLSREARRLRRRVTMSAMESQSAATAS